MRLDVFTARELDGELILAIARAAVAESFGAAPLQLQPRSWLETLAATFVTITRGEQLHGCIGSIEPRRSLHEDLRHNAVMAAFHDPRTRALQPEELEWVRFSVSILGPRTPMQFTGEADVHAQLRPRVDGLILSWRHYRGVFLPKVWDTLPTPDSFLDNLKRKAGLDREFWRDDVMIERFEVQEFEEP